MGQGFSGMSAPMGSVVYDLYATPGGGGGCDRSNQCTQPSFDHAQFVPGMEVMMSQSEFSDFKQRVCAHASQYHVANFKVLIPMLIFLVLVPSIASAFPGVGVPGIHVPFFFLGMGIFFFSLSRVVNHNNAVDNQLRGVLAEFNQRLGGRVNLTLYTLHTGKDIVPISPSPILTHETW